MNARLLATIVVLMNTHDECHCRRHEKIDRPNVLLAAEDEFGFLFPLGLLPPGRQRGAHPDGCDAHHNEKDGHHEPSVVRL